MSSAELSARLDMNAAELAAELRREPEPRQALLGKIAKELAVPDFVFFMRKAPPIHPVIPDFRSNVPGPSAKQRSTVEALEVAESIQRAVRARGVKGVSSLPKFGSISDQSIEIFARSARSYFGITLEDQQEAVDARVFYNVCRKKIEDKGVFVLHDSFAIEDGSGFCLADQAYPVIVINTARQTRGRRLFTLIHELAHVLMGMTGISDPFIQKNVVEQRCNRFAGAFLVPRQFVVPLLGSEPAEDPDISDVRWASRKLKISQEATALRLEQLGFYRSGSYSKLKRIWEASGNPDYAEGGGGANGPPPQEKVKLAKYGFRLATVFEGLKARQAITELDIYRMCGLKPKYQTAYFDYAKNLAKGELGLLEQLDD